MHDRIRRRWRDPLHLLDLLRYLALLHQGPGERAVSTKALVAVLIAVFCGIALGSRPVRADDWISSTVKSYHFDREVKHNEFNIGIGAEHDIAKDTRAVGGIYYNSNYRPSIYMGAMYTPFTIMRTHVG